MAAASPRYEHNAARGLGVPSQSAALLATLMLRGPQTVAELRANAERLHRFADISSVDAFLDELQSKPPPKVVKLARAPGEREARWAHLLCGEVEPARAAPEAESGSEIEALRAEQARVSARLDELSALVERIAAELGIEAPAERR